MFSFELEHFSHLYSLQCVGIVGLDRKCKNKVSRAAPFKHTPVYTVIMAGKSAQDSVKHSSRIFPSTHSVYGAENIGCKDQVDVVLLQPVAPQSASQLVPISITPLYAHMCTLTAGSRERDCQPVCSVRTGTLWIRTQGSGPELIVSSPSTPAIGWRRVCSTIEVSWQEADCHRPSMYLAWQKYSRSKNACVVKC